MKQILVFLYGGALGNRINTILTALSFYEAYKVPMTIYWYKDVSFYCEFTDIFKDLSHNDINIISLTDGSPEQPEESFSFDFLPYSKCLFICRSINQHIYKNRYNLRELNDFFCYNNYIYSHDTKHIDDFPSGLANIYDTFVISDPNFLPIGKCIDNTISLFIELFVPLSLSTIIDYFKKQMPTIGVHLRLTDKKKINNYLEDSLFSDIASTFNNLKNKKIFICSDDLEVESMILGTYDNCFNFKKKQQVYMNSSYIIREKESCTEAVIDFFLLCACPEKYGINSTLHTSTFFQTAFILHDSFVKKYGLIQ